MEEAVFRKLFYFCFFGKKFKCVDWPESENDFECYKVKGTHICWIGTHESHITFHTGLALNRSFSRELRCWISPYITMVYLRFSKRLNIRNFKFQETSNTVLWGPLRRIHKKFGNFRLRLARVKESGKIVKHV